MRTTLLAALLLGCPAVPTDSADSAGHAGTRTVDADEDGSIAAEDCDDHNDTVFPGATELCNAVDDDCNDEVDENAADATLWWADADHDGYGDAALLKTSCTQPKGYVADDQDCDDTRKGINPLAQEVCDGAAVDEDCDLLADDDDPSLDLSTADTVYPDADGDGIGGEDAAQRCSWGAEFSDVTGDCDDDDAARADYCYGAMVGTFAAVEPDCTFTLAGNIGTTDACPDCEFSFDSTGTLYTGDCIDSFEAKLGFDEAEQTLSFLLYSPYSDTPYELGPWGGTISAGVGYDVLSFYGTGASSAYSYSGTLVMYEG